MRPRVPVQERFGVKHEHGGPDECWPWTAGHDRAGYGMFWLNGRTIRAARVAWELANGKPIPVGQLVRHSCDNPPCVNPAHLLLGTTKDNALDAMERGRLATGDRNGARLYPDRLRRGYQPGPCRNGHPEASRYISTCGESRCTDCQRLKARRWRSRATRA